MRESRENISHIYTEHLITDILYQCIEEQVVHKNDRTPEDPAIDKAIRYIHEHAYSDVYMQAVAAHVGLSQSQFTRKFQKELGISPIRYLTRMRLQKARSLLAESDRFMGYVLTIMPPVTCKNCPVT